MHFTSHYFCNLGVYQIANVTKMTEKIIHIQVTMKKYDSSKCGQSSEKQEVRTKWNYVQKKEWMPVKSKSATKEM